MQFQLLSVSDAGTTAGFNDGNTTGSDYGYWANGSLKFDKNKGIDSIVYNSYLKKVSRVKFSSGDWINFYYNGGGTLLKRKLSNGTVWMYRDDLLMKNDSVYQINHDEGRVIFDKTNKKWLTEFDYRDQLGNLRVSFRDSLAAPVNGVYAPPIVVQVSETDPWGMILAQISYVNNQNKINNFDFTNRERQTDFDLGVMALGARMYDPIVPRFWSTDPKIEAGQFGLTPYHYSFNNPIRFSDPDGLMGEGCCGEMSAAVGGFFEGVGQAVVRNVKAVTVNLPETLQGMANSLTPFGQYQAAAGAGMLYEKTKSDWNTGDTRTRANIVGNVVGEVGIAVAGAKGAGALGKAGTVAEVAKVGEVVSLEARAAEIHGAVSAATQSRTTIAVGNATTASGDAVRIVGSSENRLRPVQRAMLNAGEVGATGPGHAEVTVLNYAKANGMTVQSVAASRPICPSCATSLQGAGVAAASPLKVVKKTP